ncbi:MAG: hypothetical protein AAGB93_00570 [Planctomycetota bacterium]
MANAVYPRTKAKLMRGALNLESADLRAVLVDLADYTYSAAHEFLSDIPAAARVAVGPTLANVTVSNDAVLDADDTTVPTVSGDPFEAIVIYRHTGVDATSELVHFDDTAGGLPFTPNSQDVDIQFDNGANKIFAL